MPSSVIGRLISGSWTVARAAVSCSVVGDAHDGSRVVPRSSRRGGGLVLVLVGEVVAQGTELRAQEVPGGDLATVQDPEIKRPITELGMVDHLEVDAAGQVQVTVLLTVSGCPMKDTIDRDVRSALGAVAGVTGVQLTLGAMTPEQRAELQTTLRGGAPAKEIPLSLIHI